MSNLIDRQAALDALADYIHHLDMRIGTGYLSPDDCMNVAKSVLGEDKLPSAQPDIPDMNVIIDTIKNAINASTGNDAYMVGLRNGMRWCWSALIDKEIEYEDIPFALPPATDTNVGGADTISRSMAIDAFAPYAEYESNRTNAEWVRRINIVLSSLPSVILSRENNMTPQKVIDILIRIVHEDWHVYTEDAINALEYGAKVVDKEIPKKPIEKRIENGDQTQVLDVCPVCGSPDIDKECGDYCPKCGQKLDWDLEAKNDTGKND